MFRRFSPQIIALLVLPILLAVSPAKAEDRILWYSVGDGLTDTSNMQAAIDFAVARNFNAICVLARYRANAYYIPNRDYSTYSNPEPKASEAAGDTLQYAIDHGHQAGLKIYAAFSCFIVTDASNLVYPSFLPSGSIMYVYKDIAAPTAGDDNTYQPDAGYPRAMVVSTDGGDGLWADPGRNDVQAHTRNVLKDLVKNYDVDGIFLDRVRYAGDSSPHRSKAFGYNPQALTDMGLTNPGPGSNAFIAARRNAITNFVSAARADVYAIKPWVIFAAVPIVYGTSLTDTYSFNFQYFPAWNSTANSGHVSGYGILDMISPQYYRTTAANNAICMDLVNADIDEGARMFHQGAFSASLEPAAEMAQSICDQRQKSMKGFGVFSKLACTTGFMTTLNATNTAPCGTGVMNSTSSNTDYTGLKVGFDKIAPNGVTGFSGSPQGDGSIILSWTVPTPAIDGDGATKYLIYRSAATPVDEYYANLVTTGTIAGASTSFTCPRWMQGTYYYKIVSVDEYNNHGPASTVGPFTLPGFPQAVIVDNDDVSPVVTFTGSWSTASSAVDKYEADYRYTSGATSGKSASFPITVQENGWYTVYEWHPQGTNRSTAAPWTIAYDGGSAVVYVNQQTNGGMWNLLGTYPFRSGVAKYARLNNNHADSANSVFADAIMFSYSAALPVSVSAWGVE